MREILTATNISNNTDNVPDNVPDNFPDKLVTIMREKNDGNIEMIENSTDIFTEDLIKTINEFDPLFSIIDK